MFIGLYFLPSLSFLASLSTSKVLLPIDSDTQVSLSPSSSGFLPQEIRDFVQTNKDGLFGTEFLSQQDPIKLLKFNAIDVMDVKHFSNKFLHELSNQQLSSIMIRINEMTFENLSNASNLGDLEKLRVKLLSMVFQFRLTSILSPILFNDLAKFLDVDGWQYLEESDFNSSNVKVPPFTLQPLNDKDVAYLFLPSLEGMAADGHIGRGGRDTDNEAGEIKEKKLSYADTMSLFKQSSVKMLQIMIERIGDHGKKKKYAKSLILKMAEMDSQFLSVMERHKKH